MENSDITLQALINLTTLSIQEAIKALDQGNSNLRGNDMLLISSMKVAIGENKNTSLMKVYSASGKLNNIDGQGDITYTPDGQMDEVIAKLSSTKVLVIFYEDKPYYAVFGKESEKK